MTDRSVTGGTTPPGPEPGGAHTLFVAGLGWISSGTASVLTLVEPLTATLLAVLILGERLGPVRWCGAARLLGAVLALSLPDRRSTPTLG